MKESDLYQPVKQFLLDRGYVVRSEVNGCDVVAMQEDELVIVELKKGVTMNLLVQAVDRQPMADAVYVAIPRPKQGIRSARWRGVLRLLKRLDVGLILVSPTVGTVEVALHPGASKPKRATRARQAVIREAKSRSSDYNTGGTHGTKLVTAYRENAVHVACCLERFGEMSPKSLRRFGTGDKTLSILYDNPYGWFERVNRGVYRLTASGHEALVTFAPLADFYRLQLPQEGDTTVTKVP